MTGLAALALAVILACGSSSAAVEASPAGIHDCATRTDYCVRMSCKVRNLTARHLTRTVWLETTLVGDGHPYADHQEVELGPNEEKVVTAELSMGKADPGEGGSSFEALREDFSCSVR